MYTIMTKVISISDEAYEALRKVKLNRSFSEIIMHIMKEKNKDNLMNFVGSLSKSEADKIKKEIYSDRRLPSRRFK